jgi:hypothetical protein
MITQKVASVIDLEGTCCIDVYEVLNGPFRYFQANGMGIQDSNLENLIELVHKRYYDEREFVDSSNAIYCAEMAYACGYYD